MTIAIIAISSIIVAVLVYGLLTYFVIEYLGPYIAILPAACIIIAGYGFIQNEMEKEQTFTVIEKKDSISADANIGIKPIMIKGSLHQPIPDKEIKNVMRIYDGAKTYTISVDKETYDKYDMNSKMIIDASDDFRLEIK